MDTNTIELKLNLDISEKFYNRFFIEQVNINGNISRIEQKEVIHSTIKKESTDIYTIEIEVLDRIYNNPDLSPSELAFLHNMKNIQDHVIIQTDNYCKILDIRNFVSIRQKAKKVVEKLSKKHKGQHAEYACVFLNKYYQNKKAMFRDLTKYDQLGFFLNRYYGKYGLEERKGFSLNYRNFIKNSHAIVDEQRIIKDDNDNCITIDINGSLSPKCRLNTFQTEMLFRKIAFTPRDKPILDKYNGEVSFATKTGELQYSDLLINFSYGDNYKKTIEYEIKKISHEEL